MPPSTYITTSIAYVNASPHIGFAMETVEADCIARYFKLKGGDVFFLTGTDEHGTKLYAEAMKQGIAPIDLCGRNAEQFKKLTPLLNLSNDDFIRTTDRIRHWPAVVKLWRKLESNGDIYKDKYTGIYCSGCEAFKTEKELINGVCPNHKKKPEKITEENYFFKLSKYTDSIRDLIERGRLEIIPSFRARELISLLDEGLQDISFSRPKSVLPWGIPVPGDKDQVMYVWCDALTNYISAIGYANEANLFQKFWNNGNIIHNIGKDILRFHAAVWPAMLISAGVKTPDKIFVHGFITSEGRKMSKSLGNVINPFNLVEKYGADALRYYLLKEIPVGKDGDFSIALFKERYNSDLANNLGNLVNRVVVMSKKFKIQIPKLKTNKDKFVKNAQNEYFKAMDSLMLHDGIQKVFNLVDYANKKIDKERPWDLAEKNMDKLEKIIGDLQNILKTVSSVVYPFMPSAADNIRRILGMPKVSGFNEDKGIVGKGLNDAEILFPKIE